MSPRHATLPGISKAFCWAAIVIVLGAAALRYFLRAEPAAVPEPLPTKVDVRPGSSQVAPTHALPGRRDATPVVTRRSPLKPAPAPSALTAKAGEDEPDLHRDQVAFLGAMIWGDRRVALLHVASEAHNRFVETGEQIGRLQIVQIDADRITIRVGDQAHELRLGDEYGGRAQAEPPPMPPAQPVEDAERLRALAADENSNDLKDAETASQIAEGKTVPNPR